jgi:cell division protein FtsA
MAQEWTGSWFLPDQMLVGLPASQLRGGAWPVSQRRSRPERPVEERELGALLERALRLSVNRLLGADSDEPDWLLVDAASVLLTVDGRGVTDPVGFRGQEIGATVFATLAQCEVIDVWRSVAEMLRFSSLTLTAAPLALAASLTDPQAMLVDVGGETTDLIWCRAGCPLALASLPQGGTDLTRALLRKWHLSPDKAERLKITYVSGRLRDEARPHVLEAMAPSLRAWLEETESVLIELNRDEPLPQRFYLLGGGSALPEVVEAVRSLAWSRRLRFARYPQVKRLQSTDVPGVVNRTDWGRGPGDVTALALAAWAAQQSRSPDRPTRILSELCHQM